MPLETAKSRLSFLFSTIKYAFVVTGRSQTPCFDFYIVLFWICTSSRNISFSGIIVLFLPCLPCSKLLCCFLKESDSMVVNSSSWGEGPTMMGPYVFGLKSAQSHTAFVPKSESVCVSVRVNNPSSSCSYLLLAAPRRSQIVYATYRERDPYFEDKSKKVLSTAY